MVDWWSALPCLLVTSLCQVVDFYTCSVALSKVDHYRVARTSSLSSFLSACGLAALLWWHLPSDSVDHALSVGVVIGACLFVLATPSLTRPLDRSQGILIGYSPNGLPLYQDPPSLLRQLRGAFVKIMENPDSRRIFYFLVLNLVSQKSMYQRVSAFIVLCFMHCYEVLSPGMCTRGTIGFSPTLFQLLEMLLKRVPPFAADHFILHFHPDKLDV